MSDDDKVNLVIGPEQKSFEVHREHLTKVSSYFKNAFTKGFLEANTKTITLASVDLTTFDRFLEWLRSDHIVSISGEVYQHYRDAYISSPNGDFDDYILKEDDFYGQLIRMYQFADEYDIPQLRRDAVDAFVGLLEMQTNYDLEIEHVEMIYNLLPKGSPLARACVDALVIEKDLPYEDDLDDNEIVLNAIEMGHQFPSQFLLDFGRVDGARRVDNPPLWSPCKYHDHD